MSCFKFENKIFDSEEKLIDSLFQNPSEELLNFLYRHVAGEVEARNAEIRSLMTSEEKLNSLLDDTTDVDSKDRIYLDNLKGVAKSIQVYHGSPHTFDRFTTDAINTGEGNQSFGWGLYFTDLKSIAENYARSLAVQKYTIDEKEVNNADLTNDEISVLHRIAYGVEKEGYSMEESVNKEIALREHHVQRAKEFKDEEMINDNENMLEYALSLKGKKVRFAGKNRNLYEVSLHDGKTSDQHTWLEWDRPVPEDILEKIKYNVLFTGKVPKTGKLLYEKIKKEFANSAKDASLFFLERGIDGVKYPAESLARGTTSDNARGFNYVVFDDNAVTINQRVSFQQQIEQANQDVQNNTIDESNPDLTYRAAVTTFDNKKFVLHALQNPNITSLVHEFGHVFEQDLTNSEIEQLEKWSGHQRDTTEYREAFARGFEKFLSESNPILNTVNKIFAKFVSWLKTAYEGIMNSPLDIELNNDMRAMYSRLLGVDTYVQEKYKSTKESIKDLSKDKIANLSNKLAILYDKNNDIAVPNEFKKNPITTYSNGTEVVLPDGSIGTVGTTKFTKDIADGLVGVSTLQGLTEAYHDFSNYKSIKNFNIETSATAEGKPTIEPNCK